MSDFRASAPSAETVFLRTYSRRKADGSRENFQEAMLRTANDIAEIGKYTDEERALVEEQALAQHAFPSGRAFWVAGTEWGKKPENFSGYYNCLHRDTLVQTLDGLKRIEDLADGSTSTVLNGNGNWVDVEFKSYGEQTLVPVTFGQKGGATQVIRSTPNHRWITRRGEVTTAELRRGDKIAKIYSPKPDANLAGVRHGIIYGDGTTQYGEFFVDLVGEKAELAGYFEDVREYQHTRAYVKQEANFKRLPWLSDPSYLRGFFQGLIATDGSVTQSVVIYGNAELAAFVADKAALAGFAFVSSRVAARAGEKTNLGERKQDLWAIVLDKGSVSEEDLLRSSHKAKLRHGTERRWWTVKSIGAKEAPETVYCTEEPETHSFVLADGLLTGNCTSTHMVDLDAFGLMVDLAMQGSGTGAVLEQDVISQLPVVKNTLQIVGSSEIGTKPPEERQEFTTFESVLPSGLVELRVGDSRQGWRYAYQLLIKFAFVGMSHNAGHIRIHLDLSSVRPSGERLKGFGGTANPIKLEQAFRKAVDLLNGAHGRQLTSVEACLLIDEAATAIVAGNIRRSAGMRQFSETDLDAANAKDGLYMQDEEGNWKVDPKKEALRMANHTRCYHHTPEYQEIEDAVRKQFYSGEGAIQYVPEAVARSNADLLAPVEGGKEGFLRAYTRKGRERAKAFLQMCASELGYKMSERELNHRMDRYGLNPCLTGDTPILTVHQGVKTFEQLVKAGEDVLVWCVNKETNEAAVRMMRNPRVTGYDQPILEIEFDSGLKVRATHNHSFFTLQRNKVQAKDLKVGQSVSAFAIHQHRDGHLRITRNNRLTDSVRQQFCHRVIAEYHGIEGEVIHHLDGDPTNNLPENLEATTHLEHNKEHYAGRCRNGFYHGTPGPVAAEHIANHKIVAVRDAGTATVYNGTVDEHHNYVVVDPSSVGKSFISGILSANCGEILGRDFHCNLAEVHLNTLDPSDYDSQDKAFYAAGLQVAALLQHRFVHERYQYSREIDPIVGVSFTGLFDFFVHSMGSEWLSWMMDGRPEDGRRSKMFKQVEEYYLKRWRAAAHRGVKSYCETHGLRIPNRITTVQPAGTKSLLTGASSGWHPPKAARFIRRITLGKTDPLVPALLEYGFNIIPAQSARDDEGNLLDDINDPRVHEVLVEIPTEVSWANLPGCDQFDLNKLPIEAQFGLYMAVQQKYADHNTSATLEIREHEIPVLAQLIHSAIVNNEGYISAAILARFDANETFPRLPFEPITKEVYDHQQMLVDVIREDSTESLLDLLNKYDSSDFDLESVSACTSASCIAKADKDERDGKG